LTKKKKKQNPSIGNYQSLSVLCLNLMIDLQLRDFVFIINRFSIF